MPTNPLLNTAHVDGYYSALWVHANNAAPEIALYRSGDFDSDAEVGRFIRAFWSTYRALDVEARDRTRDAFYPGRDAWVSVR